MNCMGQDAHQNQNCTQGELRRISKEKEMQWPNWRDSGKPPTRNTWDVKSRKDDRSLVRK